MPPADTTTTDYDDIMDEVRKRAANSISAEALDRVKGVDDLKFLDGDQWPAKIKRKRIAADRPVETINKLPGHIDLIMGELRQNKMAIKVKPAGGPSTKQLADDIGDYIRAIENNSKADTVYKTGVEGAVQSGRGAWRIVTKYADEMSFDQEIFIKRVKNPYTIYFDPAANEWDRSDGEYCIVAEWVDKSEFKVQYPNTPETANWTKTSVGDDMAFWWTRDKVRVAEYWRKVPDTKRIYLLSNNNVVDADAWDEALPELQAKQRTVHTKKTGEVVDGPEADDPDAMPNTEAVINPVPETVRERTVDYKRVEMYIIGADQVLSGPHKWAGKYIPIVPCWGKEINIEGEDKFRGQVRFAKGPQRLYNYERNAEIERTALAKVPPTRLTPEQINGHDAMWRDDSNFKYQLYNHIPGQPPPYDTKPPQVSSGNVQQSSVAADEIKATTSVFDASLGARGNETSGIAIRERKVQHNIANFTYQDNMMRSIWYTAEILVDLIPKIIDTERAVVVESEDGKEREVTFNKVVTDPDTGHTTIVNDLSLGRYKVAIEVGPHYSTKRAETTAVMLQLAEAVPAIGQVGADILVRNMDFKGSEELARRLKRAVPIHLLDQDDDEPVQPPQPTPDQQAVVAKAQASMAKAQATIATSQLAVDGKKLDMLIKAMELENQPGLIEAENVKRIVELLQVIHSPKADTGTNPVGEGNTQ